jgi:hypothetical protein
MFQRPIGYFMIPTGPVEADGSQPFARVPDSGRASSSGLFEGKTVEELAYTEAYGFNYGSNSDPLVQTRNAKLKEFFEDWLLTAWNNYFSSILFQGSCGYTLETIEVVKKELTRYNEVSANRQ